MKNQKKSRLNWGLIGGLFLLSLFWAFVLYFACELIVLKAKVNLRESSYVYEQVILLKENSLKTAAFREEESYAHRRHRLLTALINCESGGNPLADNPKSSALGIFQILDGTVAECERHLGRDLDRTKNVDSWACAIWQIR